MRSNSEKTTNPFFPHPATLEREVRARIGDELRALHDGIVKQELPAHFTSLLARFDRRKPDMPRRAS